MVYIMPSARRTMIPLWCFKRRTALSIRLSMLCLLVFLRNIRIKRTVFTERREIVSNGFSQGDVQPWSIRDSNTSRVNDTEQEEARGQPLRAPGYQPYSTRSASRPMPVVLEKYKLVLYMNSKVGKTAWRMLCRKMMGFPDYDKEFGGTISRERTGLKYLDQFSQEEVAHMMLDPRWTRALFVRDPKERLLSAYLDKVFVQPKYFSKRCCKEEKVICMETASKSMLGFFHIISKSCGDDDHWRAQTHMVEPDHWQHMNFVGHMESVSNDVERLLKRVGAWEEHGRTGWGKHKNESVFAPMPSAAGRQHATDAKEKLRLYYTPELEQLVESYYEADYLNPAMNLTEGRIFER